MDSFLFFSFQSCNSLKQITLLHINLHQAGQANALDFEGNGAC